MSLRAVLDRIHRITVRDLKRKTIHELFASGLEELGELATELKIFHGTFGNKHKHAEEGPGGEAVDLFICAVCMAYANGIGPADLEAWMAARTGKTEWYFEGDPEDSTSEYEFWLLTHMARLLSETVHNGAVGGAESSAMLAVVAVHIANRYGVDEITYSNKKLAKWEASQDRCEAAV